MDNREQTIKIKQVGALLSIQLGSKTKVYVVWYIRVYPNRKY